MRNPAIIFSLLFVLCSPAHAREGLTLAGDLRHFDYREYGDQGNLLDRESGFLPGLTLGAERTRGPWQIAGQFSFHGGGVTYTGLTNGGAPITTTTLQQISEAELRAGYRLPPMQQFSPEIYLGATNHTWRRDIQPAHTSSGMPVGGLLENYRWWQTMLGVKISGYKTPTLDWARDIDWGVDIRLTRIIKPKIKVDFSGLYDNAQLDLVGRWGYKIALPVSYSMRDSINLVCEPYLEKYALGRSSSVPLTSLGVVQGSMFEPASANFSYGVMIGIHKSY